MASTNLRKRLVAFAPLALGLLVACGGRIEPESEGPASAPFPSSADLRSVWGSSGSDLWAVGAAGAIAHFDGSAWSMVPSGITENLTGVSGTSPTDAWVTSEDGTILHWDGASWSTSSANGGALLAIFAAAPDDVWAVGIDWGGGPTFMGAGYATHWDGTQWWDSDVPNTQSLWTVWASGSGDVWMGGDDQDSNGVVLRGGGTNDSPIAATAYAGGEVRSILGLGAQRRVAGSVLGGRGALGRLGVDPDVGHPVELAAHRGGRQLHAGRVDGRRRRRSVPLRWLRLEGVDDGHDELPRRRLGRREERRLGRRRKRDRSPLERARLGLVTGARDRRS